MKEEKVVILNDKGQKLVGHYYKNKSGTLLIYCHGAESFGDYRDVLNPFFEAYYGTGVSLFWFDFTGFGESEGKGLYNHSQRVSDIGKIIDYFKASYKKIILCGVSAGAISAAIAAARYKEITKLYLVNGFYELRLVQPKFYLPLLILYVKNSEIARETFYAWRHLKPEKITIPTLIVVGGKDTIVSPKQSLRLYERLRSKKKLVVIPNGDHMLLDNKYIDEYIGEIGKWLRE